MGTALDVESSYFVALSAWKALLCTHRTLNMVDSMNLNLVDQTDFFDYILRYYRTPSISIPDMAKRCYSPAPSFKSNLSVDDLTSILEEMKSLNEEEEFSVSEQEEEEESEQEVEVIATPAAKPKSTKRGSTSTGSSSSSKKPRTKAPAPPASRTTPRRRPPDDDEDD